MEILIVLLFLIIAFLAYKVNLLSKHLTVLLFSDRNVNKLLLSKGLITSRDLDIVINDSIGNMPEEDGKKIIKCGKAIGIIIPNYMDEDELEIYLQQQEYKRNMRNMSYSDTMIIEDNL